MFVSLISKQCELWCVPRILVGEERIERPSVPLSRKLPSPPSTFDRSKASYRETAGIDETNCNSHRQANETDSIPSSTYFPGPRCNEFLNALYRETHLSSGVPLTSLRYRSLPLVPLVSMLKWIGNELEKYFERERVFLLFTNRNFRY